MTEGNPSFKDALWTEGFTSVPNMIFNEETEVSPQARWLFACLLFHGFQKGRAWPGQPRLARETGLSESTVKRAIRELEDYGLVETVRREGKQNTYYLHPEVLATPEGLKAPDPGQSELGTQVRVTSEEEEGQEEEHASSSSRVRGEQLDDAARVWQHYCTKPGKRERPLPAEERKLIVAALKVASADELCRAIDQCWLSDFHMKRGQYATRDGQVYNALSQIIRGRQGKETTRERIDSWLAREETTGVAGSGVPSVDPALIARRKQDVQRGHRLKGDPVAVRKAEEAEAWLSKLGIETIREAEDGYPTFRDGRGA